MKSTLVNEAFVLPLSSAWEEWREDDQRDAVMIALTSHQQM